MVIFGGTIKRINARVQIRYIYQLTAHHFTLTWARALQWSRNPYGNGFGVEMDGNGAQVVKMLWIGLDLGKVISLKR